MMLIHCLVNTTGSDMLPCSMPVRLGFANEKRERPTGNLSDVPQNSFRAEESETVEIMKVPEVEGRNETVCAMCSVEI